MAEDEPQPRMLVRRDGSTVESHGVGSGNPKAPPFEPGNQIVRRHGTYSPAAIAERAAEVHDALLDIAPWVDEPEYAPSVDRYLKATAREQLAHEALMAGGKLVPRLLETATAASRLAWQMGEQLGLTPAGHAKLRVLWGAAAEAERSLARGSALAKIIDSYATEDEGDE